MKKGYLILDFSISDTQGFMEYVQRIPAHIEKHGGKYIVEGMVPEILEGNWKPETIVVLEFPSKEHARAFIDDPEAEFLFDIRKNTTNSKLILVSGGSWMDADE
ncbi:MAG: hypothetical protein COA96_11610 [SAR86 cluster bacterium]|uniref:DUF1330 domain-containing protein n=1 Tax=SAR86 cluster bacterium TaxID=2030880 RepID=A0A2A5AWI8_9GAMM|nr:MAG: hypothetical protein COA96_11610 [SAR86 cluster bacterium]